MIRSDTVTRPMVGWGVFCCDFFVVLVGLWGVAWEREREREREG